MSAITALLLALQTLTLQTDFSMTISASKSQPVTYTGAMQMRGEQFRIEMLLMEAAFDGQTLSVYQSETDELTLSAPDEQQLLETNPFLLMQALIPLCNIVERTTQDNTETIVTLTPKKREEVFSAELGEVKSLTIRMRTENSLPLSLELRSVKQNTTLRLLNPSFTDRCPSFSLSHPDAYINDLR